MAAVLLAFAGPAQAAHSNHPPQLCGGHLITAKEFGPWSKKVWTVERWQRGRPDARTVAAFHGKLLCAAGPGHRHAMLKLWRVDRRIYLHHRQAKLAELNIDHRWAPHWAPDWSGPTLPPYVVASLAEEAGKVVGVDVPGWTMEEVSIGESGRRPGSAGVDVGGTRGYCLWAITWPFADSILAKYGWSYEDLWNPARCAIAMAEVYGLQGLGAWYGTSHVTSVDRHYHGRFDLRLVLGGKTLRQAIR